MVGGAAVSEEVVPGFVFSRASYLLSLLRPIIVKDLELDVRQLMIYWYILANGIYNIIYIFHVRLVIAYFTPTLQMVH